MFIRNSVVVALALAAGLVPKLCFAFDPFTVAAVVSTTASVVSTVSETAGEVAASADAFGELYGEINSDADISEDGNRLIQEIKEIESLAYEAGYTKEEVEQLSADAANAKDARNLSTTLRSITKAVRAGKRVARLLMKLEQKARLAEVESAQIEREQLVVLYKQLRVENERNLREIKERLREEKDKRDQIRVLKTEEKKSGAKVFGRTGVLSFPKQESVIEEAIRMATMMRPTLFSLMLFVFLVRALAYQFGFFGPAKYGDLIRDAVACAVLLMVFPELVRASVTLCNDLAAKVGMKELQDVQPGSLDFPSEMGLWVKTRVLLEWLFQWIKYLAFVGARFLANFGLAFLILLFPIVIFCSQMLNFSIAWPIFLGGFLSICLWPLFWNATGMLAVMLWRKQDVSISDQIATILFSLLQFLSPLIGMATLKGQPIAKSLQSAGKLVGGVVSGGTALVAGQAAGFAKGTIGASGGSAVGRLLSYPINQGASRIAAAGSRGWETARASKAEAQANRWATGATNTSWVPAIKAAAAGFATNQTRPSSPSAGNGIGKTVLQVVRGLKRQPVIRPKYAHGKGRT